MEEKILISIKEVSKILSIGETLIYKMLKEDKFPKPVKIGRKSLWRKEVIEEWANKL